MARNHGPSQAALAAAFLVASVGLAEAAGSPEAGSHLANQWCSGCHLVNAKQTEALADAPPFAEIAKKSDSDIAALEGFLMDPHPPMPQMSLTRQQIQDLLAYISSLR